MTFRKLTIPKSEIETTLERVLREREPKMVSYLVENETEHVYIVFVYYVSHGQIWFKISNEFYRSERGAYELWVKTMTDKNRALNKHATFIRSGIGEFGDDKKKGNITFRLYYKF